jgi:predicted phosphate transport protein (TIGR00153 family)
MQLLSRLMPREGQFFELFNRHAAFISQGSVALAMLLQSYADQSARAPLIDRIQELEHAADRITRETVALLHTTFVTPLDRDDIHRLISRMDDILDLIQDTAESLMLYDIQTITPETVHLGDLVKICCERVQSAVAQLANMANAPAILKTCQEIDGLESDADRVMRAGISKLFRDESDVRQIIKLKAVYELLETATDKCQDVANIIEGVVLEHA